MITIEIIENVIDDYINQKENSVKKVRIIGFLEAYLMEKDVIRPNQEITLLAEKTIKYKTFFGVSKLRYENYQEIIIRLTKTIISELKNKRFLEEAKTKL